MQKLILAILALWSFSFLSCNTTDQKVDIREYYFPVNDLEEGKVYEFQAVNNDSVAPEYWYYKTLNTDTATYLTGTFYDRQFRITQVFGEEIVKNGSIMHQYLLYETDSSGLQKPIKVNIEVPNVIPFLVRDTLGIFLFKMSWTNKVNSPEDSTVFIDRTTTLIRNRRYIGKQNNEIMGEEIECVVFEINEIIETEEVGFQEIQIRGEEHYAKGIGLVYYRKEIGPEFILEYQLYDRYPMSRLIERFDKRNNINDK